MPKNLRHATVDPYLDFSTEVESPHCSPTSPADGSSAHETPSASPSDESAAHESPSPSGDFAYLKSFLLFCLKGFSLA